MSNLMGIVVGIVGGLFSAFVVFAILMGSVWLMHHGFEFIIAQMGYVRAES